MRILLIGATGYVGTGILEEALARGHTVTALIRSAKKLEPRPNLTVLQADVHDAKRLESEMAQNDVVISAYNPALPDGQDGVEAILTAARRSGKRLLVVGGAGSLNVAEGRRLVDEPEFPAVWKTGALATVAVLERLKKEKDVDWTFLSPAAVLFPGRKTGVYRLGGDTLLRDPNGESRISLGDYAAAMLGEAERPAHQRSRFTVAY